MEDRRFPVVPVIIVAQAVWLSIVMGRGWYSGPDLANLSFAHGKDLTSGYLTASLGGHFGAPTRFLYWLIVRVDPLGWGLVVAVRVALQALATYLLWKLLRELVGDRPWLPVVLALYAFSALLVPGIAVLSSGLGLSIAQVAVLGTFLLHVRYTRTGRLRLALGSALLALLALVIADQSAQCFLLLPVLSVGFLRTSSRKRWPGWALLLAAAAVFGGLYLSGDYTSATTGGLSAGDALGLAGRTWIDVLGPSVVGGPWTWSVTPGVYSADARPGFAVEVLGQAALLALVLWSVRRTGGRALLAWSMPVVVGVLSILVVAAGRFDSLGEEIPYIGRYNHLTALALALGVTLAFARTPEEGPYEAPEEAPWVPQVAAVGAASVLVASIVSGSGFAQTFWTSPGKAYVAALTRTAERTGTRTQVYDSAVPSGVIPPIEPNHFVSDVVALTGEKLRYDGLDPFPKMIDPTGRLVDAALVPASDLSNPTNPSCGLSVQGAGRHVVQLTPLTEANSWFLQLQLYAARANTIRVSVQDAAGKDLGLRTGRPTVTTPAGPAGVTWALERGTPATVTLDTTDPATLLCLVHAYVGGPYAS